MTWKLVKHYNTPQETLVKEFERYEDGLKLFNSLNTESDDLGLELFFEDKVWNYEVGGFVTERFTVRSRFELDRTIKELGSLKR